MVSIVAGFEEHVIQKLARKLDVNIDHLELYGGGFQRAGQSASQATSQDVQQSAQ